MSAAPAPKSTEALAQQWPAFVEAIYERLEAGKDTYGDSSFDRPIHETVAEIEQELLDQAGWAFINWCKIQKLKRLLPCV